MRHINLTIEAGNFTQEKAQELVGQHFHVLLAGEAHLARITAAEVSEEFLWLTSDMEEPEDEEVPPPLEIEHPCSCPWLGVGTPVHERCSLCLPGAGGGYRGQANPEVETS